jgi:transposase
MQSASIVTRWQSEHRVDVLQQMGQLLEAENARLHARLEQLTRALAKARGEGDAEALQLELAHLREQLTQRNRALFGPSSERRESEAAAQTEPKEPKERKPRAPCKPAQLPVVELVHTLDEADQSCTECGGALQEMKGQFETAEEVTVVKRCFEIHRHKRQKYRCSCGGKVETALGPTKLVVGGRYSIDFAIEILLAKYQFHGPLERQVRQMREEGLEIDSKTLFEQLYFLYRPLEATIAANHQKALSAPIIAVDESWWRLMTKQGSKRWWVWAVVSPEAVSYQLYASRSQQAARELLAGFEGGIACDGYKAYESVRKAANRNTILIQLSHCWSHVRRKFIAAQADYPVATQMIDLIAELYDVEREAKRAPPEDQLQLLGELRTHRSAPIVQQIHAWLMEQHALPRGSLGKAIRYTAGLWSGLVRFLEDPRIPIDTNEVERALRGVVLGRKNHQGSRSERGTRVAAGFYSLVESCKLLDLNARAYFKAAAVQGLQRPGSVLLPCDFRGPRS